MTAAPCTNASAARSDAASDQAKAAARSRSLTFAAAWWVQAARCLRERGSPGPFFKSRTDAVMPTLNDF